MTATRHTSTSFPGDELVQRLCCKNVWAFCSIKALRGSQRLFSLVALCGLAIVFFSALLPIRLSHVLFGSQYTAALRGRPASTQEAGSGGLRIVVFGGGDVATPLSTDVEAGRPNRAWTEVLCEELSCDQHSSYVPPTRSPGGSVVSNTLHEAAVLTSLSMGIAEKGPGSDYAWLSEEYTAPSQLADLRGQIDRFLGSSPPAQPPQETLWIFNLGYWDIWSLAAFPRNVTDDLIAIQVRHLFSQIERLYRASRTRGSVAYSDLDSHIDAPGDPGNESSSAVDDASTGTFHLVIPSLFDVSLTPGFRTLRPDPPYPHTKIVELQNAAQLTEKWNSAVDDMMKVWLDSPDETPVGVPGEGTATHSQKRGDTTETDSPLVKRDTVPLDISAYIRYLIVQQQLHDAGMQDSNGLGDVSADQGFPEVRTPCARPVNATAESMQGGTGSKGVSECDAPQEHLFWSDFTVSQQAIDNVGRLAAKQVRVAREKKGESGLESQGPETKLAMHRRQARPGEPAKRAIQFNG